MKAIQIKFEGIVRPRYSVVTEEKDGFCYLSKKAENFIKAQSKDGNVYYGTETIGNISCQDDSEPASSICCRNNGDISTYFIKGDVYDDSDPFWLPKEDKWQWKSIEIRIIDIME